ncbi:MAG TPA: LysR substrate-binding domain-containing protein, partial [Brevibacterium sp.]|nr:LysR substrate-binding domain-containing protein [Brevibacterium sp.]
APPGMEVRALTDLRSVPFVTFRREVSPHYWEKVMAICRAADVEPQVRHQAMTWGAVLSLIRQGMGVSLLPSLIADQAPELVSRDVATGDVRSDSWLVMRSEDSASAIGQVFAELRHHFGSMPPL